MSFILMLVHGGSVEASHSRREVAALSSGGSAVGISVSAVRFNHLLQKPPAQLIAGSSCFQKGSAARSGLDLQSASVVP